MKHSEEHMPLVSVQLLFPFLRKLEQSRLDWREIFTELGFRPDINVYSNDLYVPVIPSIDLMLERAAVLTKNNFFGAEAAHKLAIEEWPPFQLALSQSQRLSDFFIALSRNANKFTSTASLDLQVDSIRAKCAINRSYVPRFKTKQKDAFIAVTFIRLLKWVAAKDYACDKVMVHVSDPDAIPTTGCQALSVPSLSHNVEIEFPSDWMLMPLPATETLPHFELGSDAPQGFLDSLRHVLDHCADMKKLDSDYIVSFTDHSIQSVQICLRKQNTSLTEEIMRARMKRALQCLTSGKSVMDSSEMAGYKDATSFSRAFKNWFGYAPRDSVRYSNSQNTPIQHKKAH